MFKTLALTAALFGSAAAVGCAPEWTGLHSEDELISYKETVTTNYCCYDSEDDDCNMGTDDCTCQDVTKLSSTVCQKGKSQTMVVEETYNYECKVEVYCNDPIYQPGNGNPTYTAAAWTKEDDQCSGTAPSPAPPALWDDVATGCPHLYETSLSNDAIGEKTIVTVVEGGNNIVYQCTDGLNALFCPMEAYEPGKGKNQFYTYAWTSKGLCVGTPGSLAPEDYPENEGLIDQGGCPQEYEYADTQDNYNTGDKVSVNNIVYQCKNDAVPGPNCGQAGNEPGTYAGDTAWTKLGSCSGTIEPTVSPSIDLLGNYPDGIPGCPAPYEEGNDAPAYEKDDKVSGTDVVGDGYYAVYKCKTNGRCGQAGYEPGVDDGRNPPAWTDAWMEDGLCQGTITPTVAPSFDQLDVAAGCPDTLDFPNTIVEGDLVSVDLSGDVEMIYKCKVPGWCQSDDYAPGADPDFSSVAWEKIGPCTGTYGPTPAPLDCEDTTNYKLGSCSSSDTEVDTTLPFGTDVDDIGVCQCTDTDANDVAITEACEDGDAGCTCSSGPTEECTYFQEGQGGCTCTAVVPAAVEDCSPADGSPDCDCVYNENGVPTCTRPAVTCERTGDDICTKLSKECKKLVASSSGDIPITVEVLNYDEGTDYGIGSVIRIHAQKYKCKDYPYGLLCNREGFGPDDQYFDEAWSEDGFCPTVAPTPAPTEDRLRVRYLRGE